MVLSRCLPHCWTWTSRSLGRGREKSSCNHVKFSAEGLVGGMLPVSIAGAGASSGKAEFFVGLRWFTSLLLLFAVTIPCTVFLQSAGPTQLPLLMSISWSVRPSDVAPAVVEPAIVEPAVVETAIVEPTVVEPAIEVAVNSVREQPAASSAPPPPVVAMDTEDVRLERVLKAAAMEDRTVIVTTLNAAWATPGSMIDLFLESFRIGDGTRELLKHLVIIALDREAYERCKSIHRHCFALYTEGVDFSGEKLFMTHGYLQLVWRKLDVLRMVLAKGYNFIFSDTDVMWFRNPLPKLYPDADFQASCDEFFGDPADLNNPPNTGFKYVKANNRSIAFYNFWYESRKKFPGLGQQGVFNFIKFDPYMKEIGVKIKFLSTDNFGGMCHMSNDLSKTYTMHTNCCVGLQTKLHDLRVLLDDWRKYMSLPPNIREGSLHSWSQLQFQCR